MCIRDRLRPYVKYAKEDSGLRDILRSVLQKYAFYINLDPYANAFNSRPQPGYSEHDYSSFHTPWVWERKYEVDSLCAPLYLACLLYTSRCV